MSETRRAILEGILYSDDSTAADKLKAADLIEKLDARDPGAKSRDFYADLEAMDDAEIDEIFGAISTPVFTLQARAEEVAREIVASDERFNAEVQRVARELAADARAEAQEAARRAQAAEDALAQARATGRRTSPPTTPGGDVVQLHPPPGVEVNVGWRSLPEAEGPGNRFPDR